MSTNRVRSGKSLRSARGRLIPVLMKVGGIVLLWSLLWLPCAGQDADDHGFVMPVIDATNSPIKLLIGQSSAIASGDVNEDGNVDIVVTATQGFASATAGDSEPTWTKNLILLLGDGQGDFCAPIHLLSEAGESFINFSDIFLNDMNADDHLDIVLIGVKGLKKPKGEVLILLGDGTGRFSEPQSLELGVSPSDALSADFNEDGRMDIAVADPYSPAVYVLLQNSEAAFGWTSPQIAFHQEYQYPSALAIGDFNEDGHIDLAVAGFRYIKSKNGFVWFVDLLLGNGAGKFTQGARVDFELVEDRLQAMNLIPVDYDHDGHLDLITSTADSAVVLLGNRGARFTQEIIFPLHDPLTDLYLCTLNNDNCWDWVTLEPLERKTEVIISPCDTGKYGLQGMNELISDPTPTAIVVIDLNNDSKNDVILVRNVQTGAEGGGEYKEWTYIDILLNSL